MQEAERQLPLLDGDVAAEYNALKEQYPNTLIGFELGGYFLFYDKDAVTVKEVLRSNLLSQENALGKVKVTGFLRGEWVAKSQKLWAEGNSLYLAGQGEDGTHHQTKYLREEDYLPIGSIIKLDGRDFRVDHVNFMFKSVSLQDMDLTNSGQPIFRSESLPHIRELYEQQQNELVEVAPEKNADYKVGDEVVVDLPTRTIEGKIGYVGETDVRIDTSAHGQSWDNEVINKQQFEDGLRQDEPTPDEELDKLPISTEVNGEWQTFPNAAAANEALNAEPVPEAAGNFHITDDNLGVGGPKQKFARKMHEVKSRKRRRELVASFYGMAKHADCHTLFKKLTGKEMRSFKDLNVAYKPEDGKKRFPGVVVSIRELVNLPIVVKDFETGIKTEQGEDRCIVAIEVNGEAKKFFTNSEEMKNILAQVKEMPDGFPFETTIKTETFGKGRTKYVFT